MENVSIIKNRVLNQKPEDIAFNLIILNNENTSVVQFTPNTLKKKEIDFFKLNLLLSEKILLLSEKILYPFYNNKLIKLVKPLQTHFNWISINEGLYYCYENNFNKIIFSNFSIVNNNQNSKISKILDIVFIKNENNLIKTDYNLKKNVLNKISNNIISNNMEKNQVTYFNENNKTYDLKKNIKKYLHNNKKYLKLILKNKFHNNTIYLKKIKNLSKSSNIKNLILVEMNIKNILDRCNFFLKSNDLNRYFLEGCIYVNGKVCQKNYVLKKNDFISLEYDENYYYYFRENYNNLNNISIFLKNVLNKSNFEKFKNISISKKIFNFANFNNDIPKFLEVDYLTMTCVVLYIPTKYKNFNSVNLKYLNIYLSRLYNWKFLT